MFEPMSRVSLLLALLVVVTGCKSEKQAKKKTPVATEVPEVAFGYDKENSVVWLDTRSKPGQRRRFDLGLGSIELETLSAADGQLTFHYTPEIEGGYSLYECKVPISEEPIKFEVNQPDGTPGGISFDLEECCTLICEGNFLLENSPPEPDEK